MKTKTLDKKGKKRSFSETSLPTKPEKQKNVGESKKNAKKAKLAVFVENGEPTAGDKIQFFVDKQKKKKNKSMKQNIAKPSKLETNTNEETTSTIFEPKEKTLNKIKRKKLENLKEESLKPELHKKEWKQKPHVTSITYDIEYIKKRIEEISSREVLTKTARKKLGVLKKKLRIEESINKSEKLDTTEEKHNKMEKQQGIETSVRNKQKVNKDKTKAKVKHVQSKIAEVKQEEDDQDDSYVMKDEDDNDESDEDSSDAEEESVDNVKEQIDDESDEDEEEDVDKEASNVHKKEINVKKKEEGLQSSDYQKKEKTKNKRYVLFVNRISYDTTADELKQHFLTKVDTVLSVRIPTKPDGTSRGFAHVEVKDKMDYLKGFTLHHSFLKKKRINVQCAVLPSKDKEVDVLKKLAIAKTQKLRALQKDGKLISGHQGKKKQKKKQNILKA